MALKVELRGERLAFFCPGCDEEHEVRLGAGGWSWNQSLETPTLMPSVLLRTGHYVPGQGRGSCWCTYATEHPEEKDLPRCHQCHSFIKDGRIRFLPDCSHALAGQTVELPVCRN